MTDQPSAVSLNTNSDVVSISAEEAAARNNSYRRGMIDQFYEPLSAESMGRLRIEMEREGLGDPSWPDHAAFAAQAMADSRQPTEFETAIRQEAEQMDQWNRLCFTDATGNTVYLSMNYYGDGYEYDALDDTAKRQSPGFPPDDTASERATEKDPNREPTRDEYHAAPETLYVHDVWYDRRDTVEALTKLLADAKKVSERTKPDAGDLAMATAIREMLERRFSETLIRWEDWDNAYAAALAEARRAGESAGRDAAIKALRDNYGSHPAADWLEQQKWCED